MVANGVIQGGVLSPYLFNFYLNSVLNSVTEMNMGCNLGIERFNIIGYADDIGIISPSKLSLITIVNYVFGLLNDLNPVVNIDKTVCMIFGSTY